MKRTFTVVMLPHDFTTIINCWDFEIQSKVDKLENKYGGAEVLSSINTEHAPEIATKLRSLYKDYYVGENLFKVKDHTKFLETVEGYRGSKKLVLGEELESTDELGWD